jgi:hypothetical protein
MIQEEILNLNDCNIQYFRYHRGDGQLVKYVRLEYGDRKLAVFDKNITKLMQLLNLKRRELERIDDYVERNRIINEAKNGVEVKVSYDDERNVVLRVASPRFKPIPHRQVINTIETVLAQEGIPYHKEISNDGRYGVFNLDLGYGDIAKYRIAYFNYNDAGHSLRLYGGFVVLVCQNGLLSHRHRGLIRIVHTSDVFSALVKVSEYVREQLKHLSEVGDIIQQLKAKKLDFDKGIDIINNCHYPAYIRQKIKDRFKIDHDGTLYGLAMAFSYIATHDTELSLEQKVDMQEYSTKLLEIPISLLR